MSCPQIKIPVSTHYETREPLGSMTESCSRHGFTTYVDNFSALCTADAVKEMADSLTSHDNNARIDLLSAKLYRRCGVDKLRIIPT